MLNRGAERYMGKRQMFRGLATSTKAKSILDSGLHEEVTDVPLRSGSRLNDEESLFLSISHLGKLPNENKLKREAIINQQEFKNPVAYAQRQINEAQNGILSNIETSSKESEYRQLAKATPAHLDQSEIYLRFLRYKNKKGPSLRTIE